MLNMGMLFEFHPEFTGNYEQDEEQWVKICEALNKLIEK